MQCVFYIKKKNIFNMYMNNNLLLIIIIFFIFVRIIQHTEKPVTFYNINHNIMYKQRFSILENNWKVIANEIPTFNINEVTIKRNRHDWNNKGMDVLFEKLKNNSSWLQSWTNTGKWFNFPLIYNDMPIGNASTLCPETINILTKIKGIRVCGFSLLLPFGEIEPHTDNTGPSFNSMALNINLTGKNCALHVNVTDFDNDIYCKKHNLELGKVVIFNPEQLHFAKNNHNDHRVILFMDFLL